MRFGSGTSPLRPFFFHYNFFRMHEWYCGFERAFKYSFKYSSSGRLARPERTFLVRNGDNRSLLRSVLIVFLLRSPIELTLMKRLALVRRPNVVCLEVSGPSGTSSFNFSRQVLRWALLQQKKIVTLERTRIHRRRHRHRHRHRRH